MRALLEQLARKENLTLLPPISDEKFNTFEEKAGFPLAPQLRQLYQICGGLPIDAWTSYVLPFETACTYALDLQEIGFPAVWNYFPVADFNESNPLCVCCGDIITGYVVHVYHDDSAYLKYRSIEAMLTTFLDDSRYDWSLRTAFIGGLPDPSHRTSDDLAMSERLTERAQTLSNVYEREDALRFAAALDPRA